MNDARTGIVEAESAVFGRKRRRRGAVVSCLRTLALMMATVSAPHASRAGYATVRGSLTRRENPPLGQETSGLAGPWGELTWHPFMLEPPFASFSDESVSGHAPVWSFDGLDAAALDGALHKAGLTEIQLRQVAEGTEPSTNQNRHTVHPSENLLLGLNPSQRTRVYALLRSGPGLYRYPFHIQRAYGAEWYAGVPLSDAARSMMDRLVYPEGTMLWFSDLSFACSKIEDPDTRRRLAAALMRQPAREVRLVVRDSGQAPALAAYWGEGGRVDDVAPLIESASHRPGAMLDLASLLPAFARERLNHFGVASPGRFEDCRWTALNFFNAVPDDRFLDATVVERTLLYEFDSIPSEYRLGDIILFRNDRGDVIHMCNYIADNLVFTKNGGNPNQPWMVCSLADVLDFYTLGGDAPEFLVLRRREPVSGGK